ncbi:TPA: restriction endonuclease subunit S [Enterococcus faecium]
MSNDTQPEIRFPGFTEAWEQRELSDISTKVQTKNKDREFTETLTNSAEFGIISQNDFFDKEISNKNNIDGYYVVKPNDFVYNPRISNFAPVGPIKRNKLGRTGVMSPLYYVFSTNNIDNQYLETYFSTSYWHKFMKLNGDSGARADRFAIRDSVFVKMPIPYPSREEQEKIGQFFEVLSNAIDLQQRKLDLLKETKKGFLQKMFPKNGAKVPEIRFPGFTEDWEERKLGDITKISTGKLDANAMVENGKYDFYTSGIKKYRIDVAAFEGPSITIAGNGATVGYMHLADNKFNAYQRTYVLQEFLVDRSFIFSEIGNKLPKKIKQEARTGNIPYIVMDMLTELKLSIPQNNSEQQKIGNFFKQLDDTITLHQRKLDLLKEMKKGFLQKMFV